MGSPDGPRFAVFDIDGVLADVRHRLEYVHTRPKDWENFFAKAAHDPLLTQGRDLLADYVRAGLHVVYSTGRPERCRQATQDWLSSHGLPGARLFMRPDRDRRPGRVTKLEVARSLRDRAPVQVVVDDDPVVVEALREDGFDVVHATWMAPTEAPSAHAQEAQQLLFEIQQDGHT